MTDQLPVASSNIIRQLIAMLIVLASRGVQAQQDQDLPYSIRVQLGVDSWAIDSSAKKNTDPGYIEEKTNLLLPDADPVWPFRTTSPYIRIYGEKKISSNSILIMKLRANQQDGLQLDELSLDWAISPKSGIRAGIIDYKTNWCQMHEEYSPWLRETNPLCATKTFHDVTGGAPGVQVYTNSQQGNYLLQTSVGAYDPLIFNYASKEYGNTVFANPFHTTLNSKIGLSINALNLDTSVEYRLSFIRAIQSAVIPEASVMGNSYQSYQMIYAAVSIPVTTKLRIQFDQNSRFQRLNANSNISNNYNFSSSTKYASTTAMADYQIDDKNLISASISKNNGGVYDESFYDTTGNPWLSVGTAMTWPSTILSFAWRHNFDKHYFFGAQYTLSTADTWTSILISDGNGNSQQYYPSVGTALGFRLGYKF